MAYSGRYTLQNPAKYLGKKPNEIIWRSTWELKMFKWLDTCDAVIGWMSEEIRIWYRSPIDGRKHRYYPDIFMKIRNSSGEIKQYLIEIKPHKEMLYAEQIVIPKHKRKTRRALQESMTAAVNYAKWQAAREAVKGTGIEFRVLTEKDLFGNPK